MLSATALCMLHEVTKISKKCKENENKVYFLVLQGGAYVVTLMDRYAAGISILFAVFFETLAVSWAYG